METLKELCDEQRDGDEIEDVMDAALTSSWRADWPMDRQMTSDSAAPGDICFQLILLHIKGRQMIIRFGGKNKGNGREIARVSAFMAPSLSLLTKHYVACFVERRDRRRFNAGAEGTGGHWVIKAFKDLKWCDYATKIPTNFYAPTRPSGRRRH